MSHICRFLSQDSFDDVYDTFVEAFSDYAVDLSYMAKSDLLNRALKNGIDIGSSVGVYDVERMVGYTLIGLDRWNSSPAAFDIGTGIIKSHRGKGLANEMFNFALPRLREKGVRVIVLEVLQGNEPAVRAYRKTGFTVVRELDCFQLDVRPEDPGEPANRAVEIRPVKRERIAQYADSLDWQPSWENSFASIMRIPDEVWTFEASLEGQRAGLLVYYPALGWILSLVVVRPNRRCGIGTAMLRHLISQLQADVSVIKALNVDHADEGMIALLRRLGFEPYVSQFEMQLSL
jgi:ribosomal protein S18 acetylase RimI-like enzyme